MIYTLTLNPALDREMTVPEISLDQVLRAESVRVDFGGKGFNVSRALLALGIESTSVGFIGGPVGEQLASGLTELGIKTDFIRIKGDTRINLSIVDSAYTHYIKVNEPGPQVSDSEASSMLKKILSLVEKEDWWILAGKPSPGIGPGFLMDVINRIQRAGARAVLDMENPYLHHGCAAGVFLVKPNAFEAGSLVGTEITTIDDALKSLSLVHKLGAQQVAISLGSVGAVYSDGYTTCWGKSPSIEQHNPVGAGDAMLAGMVWALQGGLAGNEVLKWGMACGAAAASLDGTAVGSFALVQSLANDIRIEKG